MARKFTVFMMFGIASITGRSIRVLRLFGRDSGRLAQIVWPPSGWGGLGDEAMLTHAVSSSNGRGIDESIILQIHKGDTWDNRLSVQSNLKYLTANSIRSVLGLASFSRKLIGFFITSRDFVVIGADIMDGAYSDKFSVARLVLAHCAAVAGLRSTVTGFSFNESASKRSIAAFRCLSGRVHLTCRDAVSRERFERLVGRTVELSADTVFLLDEVQDRVVTSVSQDEWLLERRSSGVAVIGLNLNDLALRRAKEPSLREPKNYVTAVVTGMRQWKERAGLTNVAVLMFPSDNRVYENESSDFELACQFDDAVRSEPWAEVEMLDYPITLAKAQSVLPNLDLLISCRMHPCILALNARVPIVGVEYAGKFSGLFQHFSPQRIGVLLSPDEFLKPEALAIAIQEVWARRLELTEDISIGLPEVRNRARNNYLST